MSTLRPNSRLLDVLLLLGLISGGAYYWHRASSLSERPSVPVAGRPTPSDSAQQGLAPAFQLPRVVGQPFEYKAGGGPALITLSAVGCGGCRQRVPVDLQAKALTDKANVPIWNIFVYSDENGAKQFQSELRPSATEFLYDRDGSVAVRTYRGSDDSCWILIDRKGSIIYRGPSDLNQLQSALDRL